MSGTETVLEVTGIADEGAAGIEGQIFLHRELGWDSIELRTIDGINICDVDVPVFDVVAQLLADHELQAVGFASSIANWSRSVTDDFSLDRDELLRAAPRMHRLNTRYLRIMSYLQGDASAAYWAEEAVRRVRELTRIAEGEGITLLLENCDGWGAATPENLEQLLEAVPSDALKVVFDMGNPRAHGHPEDAVFDFLRACGQRVAHVHIKDCRINSDGDIVYCFPGEGECFVKETIEELTGTYGYRGKLSIEPHMVFQFHQGTPEYSSERRQEAIRQRAERYVTYGKKAMELLNGALQKYR